MRANVSAYTHSVETSQPRPQDPGSSYPELREESLLGWTLASDRQSGEVEVQVYLAEISGAEAFDPPHFYLPVSRAPGEAGCTARFPFLVVLYQSCLEMRFLSMWPGLK